MFVDKNQEVTLKIKPSRQLVEENTDGISEVFGDSLNDLD